MNTQIDAAMSIVVAFFLLFSLMLGLDAQLMAGIAAAALLIFGVVLLLTQRPSPR